MSPCPIPATITITPWAPPKVVHAFPNGCKSESEGKYHDWKSESLTSRQQIEDERETDRQTDREEERQRDRERKRDTERKRKNGREREKEVVRWIER